MDIENSNFDIVSIFGLRYLDLMELIIWSFIFVISLYMLVKAAEWLSSGIQRLVGGVGVFKRGAGLAVVSICVALPELAAALAAVLQGHPELAAALAVGSSIANILLVIGIGALSAKSMMVKSEHIDQDLPLFAISVAFFYFIAYDGRINSLEAILALVIFFVYAIYVFSADQRRVLTPRDIITPETVGGAAAKLMEIMPTRLEKHLDNMVYGGKVAFWKTMILLFGGTALLAVAANFTIESLVSVSELISIPGTTTAMFVLAAGAFLPELFASLAVARKRKYEIMMGNVFSAVTINLLLVTGIAGLFAGLPVKEAVLTIGLPFLIVSAGLLVVSTMSRRINLSEGVMYLFLYFLFFVKLLGLF